MKANPHRGCGRARDHSSWPRAAAGTFCSLQETPMLQRPTFAQLGDTAWPQAPRPESKLRVLSWAGGLSGRAGSTGALAELRACPHRSHRGGNDGRAGCVRQTNCGTLLSRRRTRAASVCGSPASPSPGGSGVVDMPRSGILVKRGRRFKVSAVSAGLLACSADGWQLARASPTPSGRLSVFSPREDPLLLMLSAQVA